jgi:hypothetical protein
LIKGVAFPITLPKQLNSPLSKRSEKDRLPKNTRELVIALDHDIGLSNDCISAYVEFKRQTLSLIFQRYGNQDNDLIGEIGGDQDGDLET